MFTCPRCNRAGETQAEIQATCVDKQTIGCPSAREVVPGKDIVLKCRDDSCGRQFAFPTHTIVHKQVPSEVSCPRTPCRILVVNPTKKRNQ